MSRASRRRRRCRQRKNAARLATAAAATVSSKVESSGTHPGYWASCGPVQLIMTVCLNRYCALRSPGIGTDSGKELNVPENHVYAWEAREDAIANIPDAVERYGKDVVEQDGIHHMSTEEYQPAPGQRTEASTGHSEYMKSERNQGQSSEVYQTSEYAMARIMIGSPDFTPVPEP